MILKRIADSNLKIVGLEFFSVTFRLENQLIYVWKTWEMPGNLIVKGSNHPD